jgi:hypothetical protein
MNPLPTNLEIAAARLPATYEQAKLALASCERIDECCEWANKAEALASYAKMADDDTLRKLSHRIQARAVRRMGELLKEFDGRGGDRSKNGGTPTSAPTRRDAADAAGISKDQQVQAVRVNVDRLADERQSRDNEIKLHRELALKLIDLGYRALATRLHPDRGGSRDAMGRLNIVRDELKSIAATRRFV